MKNKYYDVVVAKEYETKRNGITEKKTAWNKVGSAWKSQNSDSISFELFLVPNQRYVISFKDKEANNEVNSDIPV